MHAAALGSVRRDVLAEERALLSYAVEQMGEAVIVTDAGGNIEYVNGAFELSTGYRRDEMLGKHARILKSDRHDDAFFKGVWDTIVRGDVWSGRLVRKRKDGTEHETNTTITPFRDASGNTLHYVAIERGLTQDLQIAARMQVASRMEVIGQISGGIAHDFNNLLSVIINYIGFVARELPATLPLQQDIAEIQKAAYRATALARQLLVFSRRQTVSLEVINIDESIRAVMNLLRRTLGPNTEIRHVPAPDLWCTRADRGQFEQVLVNLVLNARDAMAEGGTVVLATTNVDLDHDFARLHPGVAPGRHVRLTVSDTGCGMPPDVAAHAFEPFFTTKASGTGLGLATAFGIVKSFGGQIWIQSVSGEGTTFEINLPAVSAVAATPADAEKNALRMTGRGETILVAEDHDAVRTLTCRILDAHGYKSIAASDGLEALRVSEAHKGTIDLLLTDLVMPVLSGGDLALRLRETRPGLKVLLMSGYSEKRRADGPLTPDALDLIAKPFTEPDLLKRVRELLDRAPAESIIGPPKKT